MAADPLRVGRWISDRRGQLRMKQVDLARESTVSLARIKDLEAGHVRGMPQARTRAELERALQWPAGSLGDAYELGRKPEPLEVPGASSDPHLDVLEEFEEIKYLLHHPDADETTKAWAADIQRRWKQGLDELREHAELLAKARGVPGSSDQKL